MKSYIPSLLTLGNLCCGLLAIMIDDLQISCLLLLLAMLFDVFDGAVARWLNASSEFGKQLDSLVDMVSFGVAPALLFWKLSPEHSFLYMIPPMAICLGGVLRLAKFNTLPSYKYFIGLAIPSSALFCIGVFWLISLNRISFENTAIYFGVPIFLMIMMNVPIRMFSIKTLSTKLDDYVYHLILGLIVICLLFTIPNYALVLGMLAYCMVSIPFHFISKKKEIS